MSMKNPLTPAGIEPATFRFVAQLLNHCVTAVPNTMVLYYNLMGPPSYMLSFVDRNVVMRRIPVLNKNVVRRFVRLAVIRRTNVELLYVQQN